ncbi:rhomboid family intramembrane serine protease [Curvibacter sp. CHRR-16]|uniref:rhomboid family intramembrane serine protease n=1 Tax=Curvibacter sp. CHRR-16 TaxID=2835872 RepID=UPI001BD91EF8|nr:rhomboid family intramembrane serine protease [Curvibacter sp. CHRR-16]MBT0571348.1 rhomboid family intramembrane serine protease [Curvibacter sp. CHRR-16]
MQFLRQVMRPWQAVAALAVLCLLVLQGLEQSGWIAWRFVRAADGSYAAWQLIASQFVHLSWAHALGNAAAAALLAWIAKHMAPALVSFVALLAAMFAVAAVLAWDAQCLYYAGISGALHGWLAGLLLWCIGVGNQRGVAVTALVVLCLKLLWQAQWLLGLPALSSVVPIYTPAHVAGVSGGLTAMVLMLAGRRFMVASA